MRLHVSSSIDKWSKLLDVIPKSFIMRAPSSADAPTAALFKDMREAYRVASTPSGHSLQKIQQQQQHCGCVVDVVKVAGCYTCTI
jgi:hypothetical protein